RTADIDRPMSMEAMADDVAAAVQQLGFDQVDLFGYSMGAGVALQVVVRHPAVVRKLVFMSATYSMDGIHPGLMEGFGEMSPEMLYGSPWHEEYLRIAPNPEHFDQLFAKKTAMDQQTKDVPEEAVRAIQAPTLIIIGDSDLTRPEHAVEMFRLLGGGVFGDMPPGLPNSQLAVLPGTSHVSILARGEWLAPMITSFLEKPMPEAVSQ
ncbi:MAG: alpha/beta hydrolase, partial [Caldilinea sp. CFX5]|nr:alpha/beta hydrolase [Caldilinea sp. CFX5]